MPRCLPIVTLFFDRSFTDFHSNFDPLHPQNHCFSNGKTRFFQKIVIRSWHRFLIDFCANMLPFCLQKSTKILPKIDSKMHYFFVRFSHRFFFDFASILEANLEPCWPLSWRPRMRRGWFMLGLSSFSVFWASWPPLGALWARFGRVRASILEVFGAHFLHNFQVFCTHFFSNLSPMLKHLLH